MNKLSQGTPIHKLCNESFNQDLLLGYEQLERSLKSINTNKQEDPVNLESFIKYLADKVIIVRVPVPKDVDLNHYFEVMNNRGEQLEKHEVLKAKLISLLSDEEDKVSKENKENNIRAFTKIWDAAANMERYIQYGFAPEERHKIFGCNDWGKFSVNSFDDITNKLSSMPNNDSSSDDNNLTISQMLEKPANDWKENKEEERPERFHSVINFSNFLLQVLRIMRGTADVPLDDKRLIDSFEDHIKNTEDAKEFAFALLKSKFLFDQYIIKREYSSGKEEWSLKRLNFYNQSSQSYTNTFGEEDFEAEKKNPNKNKNKQILMLLSAFHVSTPTLAYKHWLNGALNILYGYEGDISADAYLEKLERMARNFIYGRYLAVSEKFEYHDMVYRTNFSYKALEDSSNSSWPEALKYGSIQNNFVFNYLDYLLWVKNKDSDDVYKKFEFTPRSSVEHFYPQHPMNYHKPLTDKEGNSFGNLCLISHSKNSRLSNHLPGAKKEHFASAIQEGKIDSLKIYEMINLLNKEGSWGVGQIKQHEDEMLQLFMKDSQKQHSTGQTNE